MKRIAFILLFTIGITSNAFAADTLAVHLFNTKQQADSAINLVNTGLGLPREGCLTKTYAVAAYDSTSNSWYIVADDKTIEYFGLPAKLTLSNGNK